MTTLLDAIVIADNGKESLSASNPLRLQLDGQTATLQVVRSALVHGGPVVGQAADGTSWEAAPKLNGIYLYNALTKNGFTAGLVNDAHLEREQLADLVRRSPRAVVISTTFMVSRDSLLGLVREIKALCQKTVVIVGGPFVAFSWRVWRRREETLFDHEELRQDMLFFDPEGDETDLYIISDVGETLLMQALGRIRAGQPLCDLPNTAVPTADGYVFTDRVDDVTSWRETPIDWASLPEEIFASGVVPMRASIGCPHQCSFCNFNKDPHLTRVKPLDDLVMEMKAVQARGARYVWFADDNFRLGKRDLVQVCERFIAEGLSLKWMTLLRAEVLKDLDPRLLRRAGCIEVQMGIESADREVLAAMNKQADPALNEVVIAGMLQAGINCTCYFIVGFPGETEASVGETIDFLRRLEDVDGEGLLSWSFYPFVLVPGSPVFESDQRERYALEGYKHAWRHCTMDAKAARRALLQAFVALEKSGPIYRGDDLDLLRALPPGKAKAFVAMRHALAKRALQGPLDPAVTHELFTQVFLVE